jgi:hypothetical protein
VSWLRHFFGGGAREEKAVLIETDLSQFRAGQVWRYRTRPAEEGSRMIVGRVELSARGDVIVHVQLHGLDIRNPQVPSGRSTVIQHLPIAEAQLLASVLEVTAEDGVVQDFEEGYALWRESYLEGKAGVFTLGLAEIVALMEQTIATGRRSGG